MLIVVAAGRLLEDDTLLSTWNMSHSTIHGCDVVRVVSLTLCNVNEVCGAMLREHYYQATLAVRDGTMMLCSFVEPV